ncbi:MAG: MFS transporter [Chloroflexi bacterium]|nr:MFS transporter [Chloroflexota bacterium]
MRPKVFYGWYVVGACLLITLYTSGVVYFGFTSIFEPLAEEFGWSYAQISVAASLRGLEVGLLAPLVGLLVDRWGPRRLVFIGSILVSVGFLLLGRVSSLVMFYGAFALLAIGMSTCTQTVLMTAVTNWFRRKAGLAIGIAATGVGLGGLLVPGVTRLIDVLQWRTAMVVVGLGMLVLVLPLSLLVRHKPEHYGYQPDGETSSTVETMGARISKASTEVNISAKQALRQRAFWHIAVAAMCHAFVVGAVVTHIMPYLSSLGIARSVSSLVALLLPVASIGGRLSSGWLCDRFGSRLVSVAGFVSTSAGLLLFAYIAAGRMWLLVPFVITFGLGWGYNVTTRISLQREYFGMVSFGTIIGFLSGIMMLGNVTGTPLAGWVFDTWDTYQGAWLGYSALTLVGAFLVFTIPSSKNTALQLDPRETRQGTKLT